MKDKKEQNKRTDLTKEEEVDARLAAAMGEAALNTPEMQKALIGMAQSADPVMVSGQMVANLIMQMKERSMKQGLQFSDKIWLAENGVADKLADSIGNTLSAIGGINMAGSSDAIWEETLNVFKLASRAGAQKPQGNPSTMLPTDPNAAQGAPVPAGPLGPVQPQGAPL